MITLFSLKCLDLNQYIPGGVLDPMQLSHELEAPEGKFKLARAILQEIPRQVCSLLGPNAGADWDIMIMIYIYIVIQ